MPQIQIRKPYFFHYLLVVNIDRSEGPPLVFMSSMKIFRTMKPTITLFKTFIDDASVKLTTQHVWQYSTEALQTCITQHSNLSMLYQQMNQTYDVWSVQQWTVTVSTFTNGTTNSVTILKVNYHKKTSLRTFKKYLFTLFNHINNFLTEFTGPIVLYCFILF